MDEPYEVGKMYRAVSKNQLIEVESERVPGLKLLVAPDQIKVLKEFQKKLRASFGNKPDLTDVLNSLIASAADYHDLASMEIWIREQRAANQVAEDNDE